ncbi:MAG: DNA replication/repair protein RecF [Bacteroidales bacterium]|nr:DNA replication/repair protein RecF [Bacteroidales bacterium]
MYLNKLKLSNFKNITETELSFCKNINCLVGENGVGKTNLLDAIHYLSFCKSYFNVIDGNNIKYDEEFFAIHGYYTFEENTDEKFSCSLKKGQRKLFRYGEKEYNRFSEHIGKIPLVMITPSDQELIIGSSELRRKFLDLVISQADIIYLDNLIKYNKVLEQRNRLLKHFSSTMSFDALSLQIWDEQLAGYGTQIHNKRKEFIDNFAELFQYYYNYITSDKELVSIEYQSSDLDENYLSLLFDSRERDRILNYTSIGVHKDDLILKMNDRNIRKYASQGQQKSFLLALKLAQFEYIFKRTKIKPILLLDDIFDKLDLSRISKLMQLVGSERFGQAFITDTQLGRVEDIFKKTNIEHKIYKLSERGIIDEK